MCALAIVPARQGSKGIPLKNIAPAGRKALLEWTLGVVEAAQRIETAILSSDSPDILAYASGKTSPLLRPAELATDDAPQEVVIAHALQQAPTPRDGIVVLLQPTSPLRTGKHVDEAIELLETAGADSVVSVVQSHALLWYGMPFEPEPMYPINQRPNRQQMTLRWEENGAIYVFTLRHWARTQNRLGGRVVLYQMEDEQRLQIDYIHELAWADASLKPKVLR